MSENEKRQEPSYKRKIRSIGIVVEVVLLAATIWYGSNAFRYMVPSFSIALILGVIAILVSLIAMIRSKSSSSMKTAYLLSVVLLALSIFVNSLAIPFSSTAKKNYPKHLAYLTRERYVPQFFPSRIPESAENYRLDFCSEDFRSSSYVALEFSCEPLFFDSFTKLAKKRSVLSKLSLEEARAVDLDSKHKAEISAFTGVEIDENHLLQLDICFPDDIDEHSHATVYIMRCSYKVTHMTTEVILLDEEQNWVCFSSII